MKRKFFIILLLLLPIAAAFSDGGMRVKIDEVEMTVPSGWFVGAVDAGPIFMMMYASPEENDDFQVNGNLALEKLPKPYTVKEYLKTARKYFKKIYSDFSLIEEDANYHIISGTVNGIQIRHIQFVTIKGKEAYILTFTAKPDNFDHYLPTFKTINKSSRY